MSLPDVLFDKRGLQLNSNHSLPNMWIEGQEGVLEVALAKYLLLINIF